MNAARDDVRRARRIADRVYMRRLGLDLPRTVELDDVIEAHEIDDKATGFEQHHLPERGHDE